MADVESAPAQEAPTVDLESIPTQEATGQEIVADQHDTESTALVPADPDSTALEPKKKTKKIMVKKKRRPARVQQEGFQSERPAQTGTIFNIWYNKWSGGDREDAYSSKHQAKGRCNVARDSGFTRADSVPGSYFCLFFARGLCPKGQDCEYLHRLPNSRIGKEGGLGDIFPDNVDCFGRDKHSDYRDDMGGVGSFMRVNRTLYVGRIHTSDDIEEVVARHFQEWGQIDRIRVLPARGVAFVTYTYTSSAEFAKEAMAHQALDNNETLNVRWATVDPNPQAQKRDARKIEEQAAEAIRRALPAEYVAEIEGRGQGWEEARKRRKVEGTFGLQGYEASDEVWYAAEKARLGAAQEPYLLEAGDLQDEDEEEGAPLRIEDIKQQDAPSGILSGSTLSALKGFTAGSGAAASKASDKPAGPLVGYGSDDDSD